MTCRVEDTAPHLNEGAEQGLGLPLGPLPSRSLWGSRALPRGGMRQTNLAFIHGSRKEMRRWQDRSGRSQGERNRVLTFRAFLLGRFAGWCGSSPIPRPQGDGEARRPAHQEKKFPVENVLEGST